VPPERGIIHARQGRIKLSEGGGFMQTLLEEFGGMQKEVVIKLEGKFPPLYIHGFS
jgi:hypothetical protein